MEIDNLIPKDPENYAELYTTKKNPTGMLSQPTSSKRVSIQEPILTSFIIKKIMNQNN